MSPLCAVAIAVEAAAIADGESAARCSFWGAIYQQSSVNHRRTS